MRSDENTKLIVVGEPQSGKSRVSALLGAILGCTYKDSSEEMLPIVEESLRHDFGLYYNSVADMIADKPNRRMEWRMAIQDHCKQYGQAAVADRIYGAGHRIYCGPRVLSEYQAIRLEHEPLAVWVERTTLGVIGSQMEITANDCDLVIDNSGDWHSTVLRVMTMITNYRLHEPTPRY